MTDEYQRKMGKNNANIIAGLRAIIKVSGHQWLAGWLCPGNRTFLEVASMVPLVVTCFSSDFFAQCRLLYHTKME